VRIGFASAAAARTFSEFELMTRAFGGEVAYKLTNRLALLSAADNLSLVPTSPPVGCRALDGEGTRFAVSLPPKHWLVFSALVTAPSRTADLSKIVAIEIKHVEER
jgi:hypothetical protein